MTDQNWITTKDGNHVLLGGDGRILGGMGGGFNGKTFDEAFSKSEEGG